MTLIELSQQYIATAKALRERSKVLNKQIDGLPPNQRIAMKRRINLLSYDAAECRRCATVLTEHSIKETQ